MYEYYGNNDYRDYLIHHGILGMKWGVRRYQNKYGSYTPAGKKRYGIGDKIHKMNQKTMDFYTKRARAWKESRDPDIRRRKIEEKAKELGFDVKIEDDDYKRYVKIGKDRYRLY